MWTLTRADRCTAYTLPPSGPAFHPFCANCDQPLVTDDDGWIVHPPSTSHWCADSEVSVEWSTLT